MRSRPRREVGAAAFPMRSTYDAGQWFTEPGVKVQVQVVDVSGQILLDKNASTEWFSCQQVHKVILFLMDIIQVDLWEKIAVYQGDMVVQESGLVS